MSERYQIIEGDCREIMAGMGANSVDVVITDPPYGLGFDYLEYEDTRENLKSLIAEFLPEAIRVAKKRAIVLCGPTQITLYPESDWVGCVKWNTTGSHGRYGFNQWTPVLMYGKDRKGLKTIDGILKSDVISINGGGGVGFQRSAEEKKHTCPKPMTIMKPIVLRHTAPGDVVLDPFNGSGSTGKAAVREGFDYIGIELDPEYVEIATARIRAEADKCREA